MILVDFLALYIVYYISCLNKYLGNKKIEVGRTFLDL